MSTAAAGAKDDAAFRRLVEPHRRELHAHCYRMLGSIHDAEDALQDALLRAWRGLSRFEGRSSLRRWLYRVATNTCLDRSPRRPKRVLPIDYGPPTTRTTASARRSSSRSGWSPTRTSARLDDGSPPRRRATSSARASSSRSSPRSSTSPRNQRAVLILREVLGFSAREVAETLDTTTASVNSALQRARADGRRAPARAQPAGDAALARRRASCAGWSSATSRPGSAATSTASSRCSPRRPP